MHGRRHLRVCLTSQRTEEEARRSHPNTWPCFVKCRINHHHPHNNAPRTTTEHTRPFCKALVVVQSGGVCVCVEEQLRHGLTAVAGPSPPKGCLLLGRDLSIVHGVESRACAAVTLYTVDPRCGPRLLFCSSSSPWSLFGRTKPRAHVQHSGTNAVDRWIPAMYSVCVWCSWQFS